MKTAVEWLIDELYKQGISLYTPELIEQAKEMEKEQIIEAFAKGSDEESDYHGFQFITPDKAIEYYNQAFSNSTEIPTSSKQTDQ
jgi:hypothetical protein